TGALGSAHCESSVHPTHAPLMHILPPHWASLVQPLSSTHEPPLHAKPAPYADAQAASSVPSVHGPQMPLAHTLGSAPLWQASPSVQARVEGASGVCDGASGV